MAEHEAVLRPPLIFPRRKLTAAFLLAIQLFVNQQHGHVLNLYESKIPIGVVQGVVGLKRWRCVATGFANHAGTTPMDRRKDALAAASRDLHQTRSSSHH